MTYRICYLTPLPADYPMVGVRLHIDQIIAALQGIDAIDLHVWRPVAASKPKTTVPRYGILTICTDLVCAGLALTTPYLPRTLPASTEQCIVSWLRGLRPDLVLLTHPQFTSLIPMLVREGFDVLVDTYNSMQSVAWQLMRLAKSPREFAGAICRYGVMRRKERTFLPQAKEVWAVSDQDVVQLNRAVRNRVPVTLVPNVVDVSWYTPHVDPEPNALGFLASFDYAPNELGAESLLRSILPALRETIPDARLYLVGRRPSTRLIGLADEVPDVVVTGTVEDTRPWMDRCAVLLAPLEQGSGTRLKILEGLAMAKPMVSTAKGCEGLDVQDGVHLLIRDIASFPAAIASLLLDPVGARAMGQRGQAFVAETYSITRLRATLGERLERILQAAVVSPG